MPIIEPISDDAPLSQGDILEGVQLFSTKSSWTPEGGEVAQVTSKLSLVVSRPCVANHKSHVTVIPIEQIKTGIPGDVKTFSDVLEFLGSLRDGTQSPDVFYIGEMPGKSGRFAARLDSWHNIQVAPDDAERSAFLANRRIGRLNVEFARDLHLRIFRAFASLGFDDVAWLTDEDLAWAVKKGQAEVAEADRELHEKQAALSQKNFEGKQFPQKELDKAQARVDKTRLLLEPFVAEQEKRQTTDAQAGKTQ